MAITHPFVSTKADGGDATLVRPSNWNANHTIGAGTIVTADIADGAITAAKLAAGASDVVVGSGTFTRDMSTASGTQTVAHGMSIAPKVIWFLATVVGVAGEAAIGMSNSLTSRGLHNHHNITANAWDTDGDVIHIFVSSGNDYRGRPGTINGTNIIIDWVKLGSPTGTITVSWLAIG